LLLAAGSLRGALTDIAGRFEGATGAKVNAKFGASGLLKDEIAGGAKADVFVSANMEHQEALAFAKCSGPVILFARNSSAPLCGRFCGRAGDGSRSDARRPDQTRHLDTTGRPVRRLRLGSILADRRVPRDLQIVQSMARWSHTEPPTSS